MKVYIVVRFAESHDMFVTNKTWEEPTIYKVFSNLKAARAALRGDEADDYIVMKTVQK